MLPMTLPNDEVLIESSAVRIANFPIFLAEEYFCVLIPGLNGKGPGPATCWPKSFRIGFSI